MWIFIFFFFNVEVTVKIMFSEPFFVSSTQGPFIPKRRPLFYRRDSIRAVSPRALTCLNRNSNESFFRTVLIAVLRIKVFLRVYSILLRVTVCNNKSTIFLFLNKEYIVGDKSEFWIIRFAYGRQRRLLSTFSRLVTFITINRGMIASNSQRL